MELGDLAPGGRAAVLLGRRQAGDVENGGSVMEQAAKRKVIDVERGLFLVRYASANDPDHPPAVAISSDPASGADIRFFLHPDHEEATLWRPGGCLVMLAAAPGKLFVDVSPQREAGSVAATIRIEALSPGAAIQKQPRTIDASADSPSLGDFRMRGHVAGIGDVLVNSGEWLAGPLAPSRIEGFSLEWPSKPGGLDIRYAVKTAKANAASGRLAPLGAFAGTRGRAMPIVGVNLELSGAQASALEFAAEACFLGSPAMRTTGKRVEVSGPTGREPLVGLKLGLRQVAKGEEVETAATATPPIQSSNRVRVFRSRAP
jgi:hypothetical protein